MRPTVLVSVVLAGSCARAPSAPPATVTLAPPAPVRAEEPPAEPAPRPTAAVAPPAAPPPGSALRWLDPAAPPLDGPAAVTCMLRAPGWQREDAQAIPLRFARAGRPYGEITAGADVALRIGVDAGGSDDPVLDLDIGGVVLRAHVDPGSFELYPARAFVLGDALVPLASARFAFRHAAPDTLSLTTALPASLSTARPAVFRRPCADVSLQQVRSLDPLALLGAGAPVRTAELPRAPLALAATPGGPAAIVLRPGPGDDRHVTVLEEPQDQARIAWTIGDFVAFGWTPKAALSAAQGPPRPQYGRIGLGVNRTYGPHVHCPRELLLVAEVNGQRRTVGRIKRGSGVQPLSPPVGQYHEVQLDGVTAHPATGARWLVLSEALADCR